MNPRKVVIFVTGDSGEFCKRLAIFLAIFDKMMAIFRNFILATLHQVPTNQVKVQKGQNSKQDSSTCQKVYHEGTMARLQNLLLLLLLVTPTILQIANPGNLTFDKDLRTF